MKKNNFFPLAMLLFIALFTTAFTMTFDETKEAANTETAANANLDVQVFVYPCASGGMTIKALVSNPGGIDANNQSGNTAADPVFSTEPVFNIDAVKYMWYVDGKLKSTEPYMLCATGNYAVLKVIDYSTYQSAFKIILLKSGKVF